MLGASEFPRRLDLSSPTFAKSHIALRDWLLDSAYGPMVARADCLDLFDSQRSWPDQEAELADWLVGRVATQPVPTDLIVHYVGHGGFRDESRDYYLAIRTTRTENPFYSSIMVDSLWRALRSGARQQRRFLIIDACFAAAAARALMAPLQEAVKVKVRDLQNEEGAQAARDALAMPDRGTAVLCSSSARDPASMAGAGGLTQFTDGLIQVLGAGSETGNDRLSLAQVHALVKASLSARYKESAVPPELHAPDQRLGLPQDVPIFPNVLQRVAARVKPTTRMKPAIGGIKRRKAHRTPKDIFQYLQARVVRFPLDKKRLAQGLVVLDGQWFVAPSYNFENEQQPGSTELSVRLAQGERVSAELLKKDDVLGLALLKIEPGSTAEPIDLIKSDAGVGDKIMGLIGGNDGARVLESGSIIGFSEDEERKREMIIVSLSGRATPGSSGSPVVDSKGHLVGIVFSYYNQDHNRLCLVPAADIGSFLAEAAKELIVRKS
jgi:hypothetical protein